MRLRWILAAAVLGVLTAWGLAAYLDEPPPAGEEERASLEGPQPEKMKAAHLYFCNGRGTFLSAEERAAANQESPALFARSLVEELLAGPRRGGVSCIPQGVRILGLYVKDSTAYLDLSGEAAKGQPGSAEAEYLTVFSLVNTLCLNVQGVSRVKILVQGGEAETLGGHVDIRYPLGPDMTIIR